MIKIFCVPLFFMYKCITMYFYSVDTTPPKQIVKDMTKDFYSAGFAPGAIVYFAYDFPKG